MDVGVKSQSKQKKSKIQGFMDKIEMLGNKLPHPVLMFIYISIFVLLASAVLGSLGVVAHTTLGDFPINNLLGQEPIEVLKVGASGATVSERYSNGLSYIIGTAINNFMDMKAIGSILIIMLAIGLMEHSGYLSIAMKSVVKATPVKLVTPVVIFLGVMSNLASDAGYVVLIPLAALMYYTLGRHPLAGLAAGFAGVSGGFSANLFVSSTDALLLPFTQASAETGDALAGTNLAGSLSVTSNWFFMMASTAVIMLLGTLVIDKFVEPRLGKYNKSEASIDQNHNETEKEIKAFKFTNKVMLVVLGKEMRYLWGALSVIQDFASAKVTTTPLSVNTNRPSFFMSQSQLRNEMQRLQMRGATAARLKFDQLKDLGFIRPLKDDEIDADFLKKAKEIQKQQQIRENKKELNRIEYYELCAITPTMIKKAEENIKLRKQSGAKKRNMNITRRLNTYGEEFTFNVNVQGKVEQKICFNKNQKEMDKLISAASDLIAAQGYFTEDQLRKQFDPKRKMKKDKVQKLIDDTIPSIISQLNIKKDRVKKATREQFNISAKTKSNTTIYC